MKINLRVLKAINVIRKKQIPITKKNSILKNATLFNSLNE